MDDFFGSKCPIDLCLPIDGGRKFCWLMKTCSEFPLHLRDTGNEVIQIVHVHTQTSGVRFVKTVNVNFIDNLSTFPFAKSLWSYLKLLLFCLLEHGFRFDHSPPRGKPVGKSPYYRSFDRSANWRVKDSIVSGNDLLPDGTKPLPEPMLTDHQWSPVTLILGQFNKRCLNHQSLKSVWKLHN